MLEIQARAGKFVFTPCSGSEEEISDPGRREGVSERRKSCRRQKVGWNRERAWLEEEGYFPSCTKREE